MTRIRSFAARGILFAFPIAVTLLIIQVALRYTDGWLGAEGRALVRWIVPDSWLVGPLKDGNIPGVGLALLLFILSLLGVLVSARLSRRALAALDSLVFRIPFAGAVYQMLRKMTNVVAAPQSGPGRFKRCVLVDVSGHKQYQIGFVTGETILHNTKYLVCFLSGPPNPTGGSIRVVPETQVVDLEWEAGRGFEVLMSYGVLTPANLDNKERTGV